jgi:hypothetical protein
LPAARAGLVEDWRRRSWDAARPSGRESKARRRSVGADGEALGGIVWRSLALLFVVVESVDALWDLVDRWWF